MQIAFNSLVGMAGQENVATFVLVYMRVAHRAAINNERMLEQIAVAFLNRPESIEQISRLLQQVRGNLGQLCQLFRIVLVM